MRTKSGDDIQTLTSLGLTAQQSEIYLTLSKMEKATIKTISSILKIDRANVYRTIKQLREFALVEEFLTYPITFKALPVNEGVMLLFDRKKREYDEIEAKAKELAERHRQNSNVTVTEEESQFALVPGGKLTYRVLFELMGSSERTHEGIIYCKHLEQDTDFFVNLFRKLSLKGVKLRLVIFLQKEEKLPTEIEVFRNCEQIEIRKTGIVPRTTFSIWDGKKAFLTTAPTIFKPMCSGLLMANSALVGLIRDYFEIVWQHSEPMFT
ncbi:hypothetical protein G4O51_11860 [Candidatus Bathyarchaeota archaeon A05DMB-2]|nr:hypothetical protein [Candidatus Bathyarchaeota archaeon A05DMB-2]